MWCHMCHKTSYEIFKRIVVDLFTNWVTRIGRFWLFFLSELKTIFVSEAYNQELYWWKCKYHSLAMTLSSVQLFFFSSICCQRNEIKSNRMTKIIICHCYSIYFYVISLSFVVLERMTLKKGRYSRLFEIKFNKWLISGKQHLCIHWFLSFYISPKHQID